MKKRNFEMKSEFKILRDDIHDSLKKGEPTLVLDRLHTYTIKIVKLFCVSHDIEIINDKNRSYPLHSLIGMLSKYYSKNGMVTKFSEIVMKSSISIFEKFNEIRNNRSFAHDNEIISDQEAMFIIKTVMNLLEFLDYVEMQDPNIIYLENLNKEDIYKLICLNKMSPLSRTNFNF